MADKVKPFEEIFPYISYRWKYDDGEYSPYAPFSEVQFVSKEVTDYQSRYEKGFNEFMVNDIENIVINGIPKGREDVVAIDILYTESISSTVYILKTIEFDPGNRGNGTLDGVIISKRAFGSALPDSELTRQFDSVPLKAKAQEFTANRIIYGNYTSKFNQGKNDLGGDGFKIKLATAAQPSPVSGPSVKTNRTYDVGVVYMDKYGRQGNVLTQATGNNSENSSLIKTNFTYGSRIKLAATINSQAPSWAEYYKYYIKDVGTDFYNMTCFNTYLDGEEETQKALIFICNLTLKDRNKITEDSFLIPRRNAFSTTKGDVITEFLRVPVLDIENEAPDTVKAQVIERDVIGIGARFPEGNSIIIDKNVSNNDINVNITTQTVAGDTSLAIYDEAKPDGWKTIINSINRYLTSQDSAATLFEQKRGDNTSSSQLVNVSGYSDRLALKIRPHKEADQSTYQTDLVLVETIEFLRFDSGGSNVADRRNCFKFTLSNRVNEDGDSQSTTGLSKGGVNLQGTGAASDVILYKLGLSETGQNKLKGSFFVKVPKKTDGTTFTSIPLGQTKLDEDGEIENLKVFDFETEPTADSNLNLYWESAKAFSVDEDHGKLNVIPWTNCIATVGGNNNKIYLESINIQDKFNSTSIVKGIRVNTPEANYAQETRKQGLIFSGLYNSRTGINELNKFNLADGITKELEPNYGGIQKLHALDTNLISFNEDKIFKILADKDALFNADEGVNVTATNLVLGQAMSFQGEYGISTHPESFASFGNNIYFTDAKRGVVMQLTPANGQLFAISSVGMSNFFRDRLGALNANAKLIGAYDGYKKQYVLSLQGYDETAASIGSESIPDETSNLTIGYSLSAQSWVSRYSFIPETGVTLNNKFYTFKNGKIYLHNSDTADRNNFYGTAYDSQVQVIFNDNPTYVSDWLSLNYQGDEGWEASEIIGDQDSIYNISSVRLLDSEEVGFLGWFLKEGKYHGAIVGTQPVYIIDPSATEPGSNGFWPLIQDGSNTQDISGTKGFFQKTRFKNSATTKKELFAVSSEYYISQS
jgi:hypothetical protein